MVAHADELEKKVLETLDVASTNGNCKREERARGTSPSFVNQVSSFENSWIGLAFGNNRLYWKARLKQIIW